MGFAKDIWNINDIGAMSMKSFVALLESMKGENSEPCDGAGQPRSPATDNYKRIDKINLDMAEISAHRMEHHSFYDLNGNNVEVEMLKNHFMQHDNSCTTQPTFIAPSSLAGNVNMCGRSVPDIDINGTRMQKHMHIQQLAWLGPSSSSSPLYIDFGSSGRGLGRFTGTGTDTSASFPASIGLGSSTSAPIITCGADIGRRDILADLKSNQKKFEDLEKKQMLLDLMMKEKQTHSGQQTQTLTQMQTLTQEQMQPLVQPQTKSRVSESRRCLFLKPEEYKDIDQDKMSPEKQMMIAKFKTEIARRNRQLRRLKIDSARTQKQSQRWAASSKHEATSPGTGSNGEVLVRPSSGLSQSSSRGMVTSGTVNSDSRSNEKLKTAVSKEKLRKQEERRIKNREIAYVWRLKNKQNEKVLRDENNDLKQQLEALQNQVGGLMEELTYLKNNQDQAHCHTHSHPHHYHVRQQQQQQHNFMNLDFKTTTEDNSKEAPLMIMSPDIHLEANNSSKDFRGYQKQRFRSPQSPKSPRSPKNPTSPRSPLQKGKVRRT